MAMNNDDLYHRLRRVQTDIDAQATTMGESWEAVHESISEMAAIVMELIIRYDSRTDVPDHKHTIDPHTREYETHTGYVVEPFRSRW